MASEGVVVNHSGACSASAAASMRAIGFHPLAEVVSPEARTSAAAPSFMVLALAAVTVPSDWKAGERAGIFSNFTFHGSSSLSTTMAAPFLCGTSTGTTSSWKRPSSHARWLRR